MGRTIQKIITSKNLKIVNIVKMPFVNKKPLTRKQNYVQTSFSHSTLKLEQKNARRKTTRVSAAPVSG